MDEVKRKRGRPSNKVKLFSTRKIQINDILKIINSEREIVNNLDEVEKLVLNVTLVFSDKNEKNEPKAFYEIEIEDWNVKGKRPPKKKVFKLNELFPSEFPIMEATQQDVKRVHFNSYFNLRERMFDNELENVTGTNLITRDYTRVETNDVFKYFNN